MAFSQEVKAVTTEASVIFEDAKPRDTYMIFNPSGNPTVYFGGPDVETTDGQPIPAGQRLCVDVEDADDIGYIVSSSSCNVRLLRRG